MKVRTATRRQSSRSAVGNRVEWALVRHVHQHPGACNVREILSAARELRASGHQLTMSLKINGRTIR